MRKLYIVKHDYDFDRIIEKNNFIKSEYFVIYQEDNNLKYDCFGISVGKKLGNAVYRNKMKRKFFFVLFIISLISSSVISFPRRA